MIAAIRIMTQNQQNKDNLQEENQQEDKNFKSKMNKSDAQKLLEIMEMKKKCSAKIEK
ncbi:MAG: hypothetical protein IPP49_07490 [Saprospiraceae bacterium]|nr:hypothetical protein [Saprospiraceae bacterium]